MPYRMQCCETISGKGGKNKQIVKGVYQRVSATRLFNGKPDVCFDISYKKDGKKIWEKVGWLSEGYSARLAATVRSERMRSIRHDEELPKERKKAPTFKEVAEKYIAWAKANKKSAEDDESRYVHHLRPEFDNKRLDEISSLDVETFKSALARGGRVVRADDKGRKAAREEGLSDATVKHCLALIRQIYNKAMAWGLYEGKNPIKDVKLPTLKNGRERFLNYEEADGLLTELKAVSGVTHDVALLSLHCGLRAGEIFNLKAQDVDLSHGIIRIVDPKNTQPRAAYMTEAVKEILKARMPETPEAFVFTERGNKERINQVSQAFAKTVGRLGFNRGVSDRRQRVSFHSLRHTHASWLALQGESLLTIAEALGHKTLVMVRRYAHLIPAEKKRAALDLEKAFNEGVKSKQDNTGRQQ
jgi:integrase